MMNEIIFNEGIHIVNNLKFRTESSKVLANYKLSQSFTLTELMKTTTHNFTVTAKELVLAKFDAWFLFLIDTEYVITMSTEPNNFKKILERIIQKCYTYMRDDEIRFLEGLRQRETVLEYDIKEVIKLLALYRYRIYNKVINNEPIFNKEYIKVWDKVHSYLFQMLLHKITATKFDQIPYYSEIGLFVSRLLHHTLYEVYEIDVLFDTKNKTIILNYDDIVAEIWDEMKINVLVKRLEIYIKKCQELGYQPTEVRLKIYEDKINELIVHQIENVTQKNNIKLIKE